MTVTNDKIPRTYVYCPRYFHRRDIDLCELRCDDVKNCKDYRRRLLELRNSQDQNVEDTDTDTDTDTDKENGNGNGHSDS